MSEVIKSPYVGVSGVTSPAIQSTLERLADQSGLYDAGRKLALGVKAVHKTQFLDVENKYGKAWYPVGEEAFRGALRHDKPDSRTIAVAQTYLDVEHVGSTEYRTAFLRRIVERGSPWLQAIQFDMLPWHKDTATLNFLGEVKDQGVDVFLQVHKAAMEELGPTGIIRRLGQHAALVDYILFDASHGTGKRLDVEALRPFIAEAYDSLDTAATGIALAGGLNGDIVREDLPAIVQGYPGLSWDAEGQLHPVRADGTRPLDLAVTADYLSASAAVLQK